jgi:hypothetical protein
LSEALVDAVDTRFDGDLAARSRHADLLPGAPMSDRRSPAMSSRRH